jgi:hypothetical protein
MPIFRILNTPEKTARSGPNVCWSRTRLALIPVIAVFLAGCGGGKPSTNNTVAQVLLQPASASLVSGQVLTLSASALNSSGAAVAATFTFNSTNTNIATISPRGEVCGGVWDATFVVCNGDDASGNPINGTAIVTATASGITSGPVNVAIHPSVTSVSVDPITPGGTCSSIGQTHQFTPHAFHNGIDITSLVGNFSWSSSDSTVVSVDANGLATARVSGLAGVVASIGGTTSPATPFKTCMPVQLTLHLAGDTGTPTESATLNVTDTKILLTDMIDENGAFITPAPVTVFSNNPAVGSVLGGTITAQSPGGAGFVAGCAPPSCGNGLNTPIYSNLFSLTVTGTSPNTTTVYAASAFPPPINTAIPLIPIDVSKAPPVAGAAIALPGTPNSIVFDRAGLHGYIGTAVGLATLDPTTNAVVLAAPAALGKVLAVSNDGNLVILSNAANDPSTGTPIEPNVANQRMWVFDRGANTLTTFISPGAVAASFDDDGFKAYAVANNGNVYVFSPLLTLVTKNIGGSSVDVVGLPSVSFVYVANSGGLDVLNACNNVQRPTGNNPPTNSSPVQLLGVVKNVTRLIAVDQTGVNVETANLAQLTPPTSISASNCAPNVSYSNQFIDLGQGVFTARQLLVGSNGSHIAVLPVGLNRVLTAVPGTGAGTGAGVAFLPAGGTEPLSGGLTPDGNTLWVGVNGTNSVDRINLLNNVDEFQLPMSFKKGDGSPAPPNLVVIRPK